MRRRWKAASRRRRRNGPPADLGAVPLARSGVAHPRERHARLAGPRADDQGRATSDRRTLLRHADRRGRDAHLPRHADGRPQPTARQVDPGALVGSAARRHEGAATAAQADRRRPRRGMDRGRPDPPAALRARLRGLARLDGRGARPPTRRDGRSAPRPAWSSPSASIPGSGAPISSGCAGPTSSTARSTSSR